MPCIVPVCHVRTSARVTHQAFDAHLKSSKAAGMQPSKVFLGFQHRERVLSRRNRVLEVNPQEETAGINKKVT